MRGLLAAALAICVCASQERVNFRGAGQMGQSQIQAALLKEMAETDKDLALYEKGLRSMFVSLPKNKHGNLGHQAVRTALHRFFVHRHGWWLRGLYLSASIDNVAIEDKDRVPDLLQEAFESRGLDRGADLHALAALAAAIEELVTKETLAHLQDSYKAVDAPEQAPIPRNAARDVTHTYFMSFLLEHNWTVESHDDLLEKNRIFAARYPLYTNASGWLFNIFDQEIGSDTSVSFERVVKVASRVGEEYRDLNDKECTELTATLQTMETRKPGRVRLSVFYNMSLHSHWKFNERVDALRDLGALDESDPAAKYVIIPNYAIARPNCVNASNIYEICCPNLCEPIMSHLERDIGNSSAPVERISKLIANYRSDSVQVPREMSKSLLDRLEEIAWHHGGHVPLHGRLFAQWLHHVYPMQCPYPHESGTTNPALYTGEESDQVSESEIMEHVAADSCTMGFEGKIDCGEESSEIPWSTVEEMLLPEGSVEELQDFGSHFILVIGFAFAAAYALGAVALRKGQSVDKKRSVLMLVTFALAALASWAGLLDPTIMIIAAVGGVVANLALLRARARSLPAAAKTV